MNVFIDTSAFYAVIDADDQRHHEAVIAWEDLLGGRAAFHTTSYVLIETTSLLQNRIGVDALRTFAADILPVANIAWVDESVHLSAFHALLISAQRRLSLVDCVSFETMRRMGIENAFCFDPHFAEQGFQVIPASA